jgi:hypothetical protein
LCTFLFLFCVDIIFHFFIFLFCSFPAPERGRAVLAVTVVIEDTSFITAVEAIPPMPKEVCRQENRKAKHRAPTMEKDGRNVAVVVIVPKTAVGSRKPPKCGRHKPWLNLK